MGATVKVSAAGLKQVNEALGELKFATRKAVLRRGMIAALEPMAERARQLAPDDPRTGAPDLHRSIVVSEKLEGASGRTREGDTIHVYLGPTKDGYPQAMVQEFGTAHHGPQPYLRPAYDEEREATVERLGATIGTEIDKNAARAAKRKAKLGGRG